MKKQSILAFIACALLASCHDMNRGNVWDDTTSGSYRGTSRSLWGDIEEPKQKDDFFEGEDVEFVALRDEDLHTQFADGAIPQPKNSPGEAGSGLPGLDAFYSPTGAEAALFKNVLFGLDDHILRDKEYTAVVERIADYMKTHPKVYVFVSGHCDERGPEAYNLSLGARRANYIRTMLVEKGIDPERVHTVSYGKEKPIDFGHNQAAWNKNRRAEFKIYHKS